MSNATAPSHSICRQKVNKKKMGTEEKKKEMVVVRITTVIVVVTIKHDDDDDNYHQVQQILKTQLNLKNKITAIITLAAKVLVYSS
jgi:hypothetical protein